MFDELKKKEVKDKMKVFNSRTSELRRAMDKLVSEHRVLPSLDDAYLLISGYIQCKEKWESDYCKDYLKNVYQKGYGRYDRERLF